MLPCHAGISLGHTLHSLEALHAARFRRAGQASGCVLLLGDVQSHDQNALCSTKVAWGSNLILQLPGVLDMHEVCDNSHNCGRLQLSLCFSTVAVL